MSPSHNRRVAPPRAPPQPPEYMVCDAIEVRESIEAKGDMDEDVEMGDAGAPRDAVGSTAKSGAVADAETTDAGTNVDADAEAEGEPGDDIDADGDPDDEVVRDDGTKDMLSLIRETSEYLCDYKITLDGEYVQLR